jgi:F-box and leucine-rich repeat protein GRR1
MNCNINNQALISIFNHNQELRELRLSHADITNVQIDDRAFINSSLYHQQQQRQFYQQLRLVDFTGLSIITDISIEILVQAAPKIRSLVLNKCSQITDQGVLSICKLGRYLHFLHLGHCSKITDQSIQRLAFVCPRIRYLDMACCTNITDLSVIELSKHLPTLKRIGLVKCILITDAAIQSLTTHARVSSSIERIHLSYCTRLSVNAIAGLLSRCHKLIHLSLTHVPSFLRDDLQQFCRPPPKDFTEVQRHAFCVYSGVGVQNLKHYLDTMYCNQQYYERISNEEENQQQQQQENNNNNNVIYNY